MDSNHLTAPLGENINDTHFIPLYINLRTCEVILERSDVQTVLIVLVCRCWSVKRCIMGDPLTKEGVDGSIPVFMLHLLLPRLLRLLADVDSQPGTDHPVDSIQSQRITACI